jgi:menaquinone-dependent protoporphyrinogen IX oxidase
MLTTRENLQIMHGKCMSSTLDRQSILILYDSKYGATKRYASWVAKRTGGLMAETGSFDISLLGAYDVVLVGSPVYFGRLWGRRFIKQNWAVLKDRKTVVFGVTGIPSDDPRQKDILGRSFPRSIRDDLAYYPLRGAFNYSGLKFWDKVIMSGPRVRLQIRWWLTRDRTVKEMLNRFKTPIDWATEAAIDAMCLSLGM